MRFFKPKQPKKQPWLLVGLGNPGPEHEHNRHNIGFMAVEEMARRHEFSDWKKKFQGLYCEGEIDGEKVLALKPMTFMNLSGASVSALRSFYKIPLSRIVVFHDELDLAPAKLRIKQGGGAAGHNGLRSIDAAIGQEYWRARLGIGHPGDKEKVHGYVLGNFSKADKEWLPDFLDAIAEHIPLMLAGDPTVFMSKVAQKAK